jgi:hypothetical protein
MASLTATITAPALHPGARRGTPSGRGLVRWQQRCSPAQPRAARSSCAGRGQRLVPSACQLPLDAQEAGGLEPVLLPETSSPDELREERRCERRARIA